MANHQQENSEAMKKALAEIEKQVVQFLDRIVEAESAGLIKAYEDRIKALEAKKLELNEKIKACGRPLTPFDNPPRFPQNPQKL